MNGEELRQRLAAILVADAVGYSALMAADERAALAALDHARAVSRTQVESNQGRVSTWLVTRYSLSSRLQ